MEKLKRITKKELKQLGFNRKERIENINNIGFITCHDDWYVYHNKHEFDPFITLYHNGSKKFRLAYETLIFMYSYPNQKKPCLFECILDAPKDYVLQITASHYSVRDLYSLIKEKRQNDHYINEIHIRGYFQDGDLIDLRGMNFSFYPKKCL